ncbi:MAG: CoA-binding protein [Crocinitomicaceae bacterium]|nr:CoA-binding protein [Crocinitomicaceae bacterium]
MVNKPTVVIGASPDSSRYSYLAVERLLHSGHTVYPLGKRKGSIHGLEIIQDKPPLGKIDTVTLYVNPAIQKEWYSYILNLQPLRVIFNPGTENPEFAKLLSDNGITFIEACTLVLLSSKQY